MFVFYVARSTVLAIYPEYLAARSRRQSIYVHTPSPFFPSPTTSTPCSSMWQRYHDISKQKIVTFCKSKNDTSISDLPRNCQFRKSYTIISTIYTIYIYIIVHIRQCLWTSIKMYISFMKIWRKWKLSLP